MKKEKSIGKKIVNTILSIILGITLLVVCLGVIQSVTGKDILPFKILYIYTDSMEPTISKKSYILVKKTSTDKLVEGETIITFISSDPEILGEYNTHRYMRYDTENNDYITKGDHNLYEDYYHVRAEDIKYEFVCNLGLFTAFANFYKTETGLLCTVALIIGSVSIWLVISNKKSKEELMDELVKEEVAKLEEAQNKKDNNI